MRAPFDCAINQNAAGIAQTGEGSDERDASRHNELVPRNSAFTLSPMG
jgi:hypothetical protein